MTAPARVDDVAGQQVLDLFAGRPSARMVEDVRQDIADARSAAASGVCTEPVRELLERFAESAERLLERVL